MLCKDILEKKIRQKGLDPATLQFYIDSFRHGISPHGGGGIGKRFKYSIHTQSSGIMYSLHILYLTRTGESRFPLFGYV